MIGQNFVRWINLAQSTDFKSESMTFDYGRGVVSLDFFDSEGSNSRTSVTGSAVVTIKTTTSEDRASAVTNGTVDVSLDDYDKPFFEGPADKVFVDFSGVVGGAWARVSVWRGY